MGSGQPRRVRRSPGVSPPFSAALPPVRLHALMIPLSSAAWPPLRFHALMIPLSLSLAARTSLSSAALPPPLSTALPLALGVRSRARAIGRGLLIAACPAVSACGVVSHPRTGRGCILCGPRTGLSEPLIVMACRGSWRRLAQVAQLAAIAVDMELVSSQPSLRYHVTVHGSRSKGCPLRRWRSFSFSPDSALESELRGLQHMRIHGDDMHYAHCTHALTHTVHTLTHATL